MKIEFILNGRETVCEVPEHYTLLRMLRETFGLTGTKKGCDKGECGACTVVMDGKAVTSCTVLAATVSGREVITIEYLSEGGRLHVIQEELAKAGAVQCGFCTPGMVMSAYALFIQDREFTREEIKKAISGNLCRCTGYEYIVDGIDKALKSRSI
ncbi:MAG: (2Fe-2S)-binding protein [Candidatus Muiribacteriaceae bacterium]